MVSVRKAMAYSKRKVTAYTRKSKKKAKNYVKTVPQQKVTKFNMGKTNLYNKGKFKNEMRILAGEPVQIRDLALEACRMILNNQLNKRFIGNYYLGCRVYPHQILRDNKTFSGGTKGERVQTGMKHSFGSTMGRAAVVKKNQMIFIVAYPTKKDTVFVRHLCKLVCPKLPCKTKVIYSHVE